VTLIAALRCRDGVVLCSDSQQTRGARGRRLARSAQKVYEPRSGLLLAAAGAQDVAQEFSLRLQRMHDLTPNADRLELKSRLQGILRQLREDPGIEGRSDHVEFLLAWWSRQAHKPVALHLYSAGAAEWVDSWAFGGIALGTEIASFAVSTMRYIDPARLTLEQAQVVAVKVLRDTIETSVEGIGGGVQTATVGCNGVHVTESADMRGLHHAVDVWEARCAELLCGRGTPPPVREKPARRSWRPASESRERR
jgi:20S proteasome alpha/beta subunit